MKMQSVVVQLRRRCRKHGQAQTARDLGVSRSFLSHILANRRQPGPKLLKAMGLQQVIQPTNGS